MRLLPAPVLALLGSQFGAVARFQLLDHLTEGQVDGLVERRVLVPIFRGVYRVSGSARTPQQIAMAAVLRCRLLALVTGPLVLALLNVDGFTLDDPFEILTHPDRRLTNVPFLHRANPTPGLTTAKFGALPIVHPTVALVDSARFAAQLGDRRIRLGYDACRWKNLTDARRVRERALALGPGDPGAAFFLALLGDEGLAPESERERRLGGLLGGFDPAPEPQCWVTPKRRVDWFWRPLRLAIEYLGGIDHGHAEARVADQERDGELEGVGVRVVPVVAHDLDDPERFVAWMQALAFTRAIELGIDPPRLRKR